MVNRPKHDACRSQLAGDAFRAEMDRQQAGSYEELQLRATHNRDVAFVNRGVSMNRSSIHNERATRVPPAEGDWPRDFDFREAYAEHRELLDEVVPCRESLTHADGADRNE